MGTVAARRAPAHPKWPAGDLRWELGLLRHRGVKSCVLGGAPRFQPGFHPPGRPGLGRKKVFPVHLLTQSSWGGGRWDSGQRWPRALAPGWFKGQRGARRVPGGDVGTPGGDSRRRRGGWMPQVGWGTWPEAALGGDGAGEGEMLGGCPSPRGVLSPRPPVFLATKAKNSPPGGIPGSFLPCAPPDVGSGRLLPRFLRKKPKAGGRKRPSRGRGTGRDGQKDGQEDGRTDTASARWRAPGRCCACACSCGCGCRALPRSSTPTAGTSARRTGGCHRRPGTLGWQQGGILGPAFHGRGAAARCCVGTGNRMVLGGSRPSNPFSMGLFLMYQESMGATVGFWEHWIYF